MSPPDFLVIGAFRYALGRQSYVVGETAQWLDENWNALSENARFVIRRDLAEAIAKDDQSRASGERYHDLGSDMDRAEWIKLAVTIGLTTNPVDSIRDKG